MLMGTRSLTYVYDNGEPIVCMYRQYDGYPTGHGAELAEFLNKCDAYNGIGCLSAQLVANFKTAAYNIYLHTPILGRDDGQEYEYYVTENYCRIYDTRKEENLFEGSWVELEKYCSSEKYGEVQLNTKKNIFDGSMVSQDWLKSVLLDGVAVVNFVKVDGTERAMKCTLKEDLIPQNVHETKRLNPIIKRTIPDVLPVYDVEANGWRSFRWDSIKSVEIGLV
jgi:hypothetical protein